MVRVFVFLAAVQVVLVVLALISCLSAERVRTMPRALWVLVILLLPLLGPVAYFVAGRPVSGGPGGNGVRPAGPPPRPSSPDDDPDFLRKLDAEQARRDRELLARLERDMQRPEEKDARERDDEETPPAGAAGI